MLALRILESLAHEIFASFFIQRDGQKVLGGKTTQKGTFFVYWEGLKKEGQQLRNAVAQHRRTWNVLQSPLCLIFTKGRERERGNKKG